MAMSKRAPRADRSNAVEDRTVELGWYDNMVTDVPRLSTGLFGTVPAPTTLEQYLATAIAIGEKFKRAVAWRGQADIEWPVRSSAVRRVISREWISPSPDRVGEILVNAGIDNSEFHQLESQLLRDGRPEFVVGVLRGYEDALLDQARALGHDVEGGRLLNDFELFGLLQHYGAATPLLDVSRNAMLGLWFAAEKFQDKPGVVAVIGVDGVTEATSNIQVETWRDYRRDPPAGKALWWVPRRVSPRMAAQEAAFVTTPYWDQPWGSVDLEATIQWESERREGSAPTVAFIAVTSELKAALHASSRLGVTAYDGSTIYPDLPGFAQYNGPSYDITLRLV